MLCCVELTLVRLTFWGVNQRAICFSSPEIEAPYVSEEEKQRLLELYQYLHSRAHNSSRPLKNIYFTGPSENLLAWVRTTHPSISCPTSREVVMDQPSLCHLS